MTSSSWILRFLYIGTADFERDLVFYRNALGARLVWQFQDFGARVAAVTVGDAPLLLLADHRPAPSCMPVFQVANLAATAKELKGRGWKASGRRFEIPNGPCYRFDDPSGNPFALFEDVRPNALTGARDGSPSQRADEIS